MKKLFILFCFLSFLAVIVNGDTEDAAVEQDSSVSEMSELSQELPPKVPPDVKALSGDSFKPPVHREVPPGISDDLKKLLHKYVNLPPPPPELLEEEDTTGPRFVEGEEEEDRREESTAGGGDNNEPAIEPQETTTLKTPRQPIFLCSNTLEPKTELEDSSSKVTVHDNSLNESAIDTEGSEGKVGDSPSDRLHPEQRVKIVNATELSVLLQEQLTNYNGSQYQQNSTTSEDSSEEPDSDKPESSAADLDKGPRESREHDENGNTIDSLYAPCAMILFFSPSCPFSVAVAPLLNRFPDLYPTIPLWAVDVKQEPAFGSLYGIVGTPSLLLFHNARPAARFNHSVMNQETLANFINWYTGIDSVKEDLQIDLNPESSPGPLPVAVPDQVDPYLVTAWLFVVFLGGYMCAQSDMLKRMMESVRASWREAAEHQHQD